METILQKPNYGDYRLWRPNYGDLIERPHIIYNICTETLSGDPIQRYIQGVRKVTIQSYKLLYSFVLYLILSDVTHVFSEIFINIKVLFLLLQINILIQYLTVLQGVCIVTCKTV